MKTRRIQKIYNLIQASTESFVTKKSFTGLDLDANNISITTKFDRTNVSKDLNVLWKEGKLLKIQGRPVYYLDKEILYYSHKKAFPSTLLSVDDLFKLLNEKPKSIENISKKRDDPFDQLQGNDGILSYEIAKAKAALIYPKYGRHTLIIGDSGVGKSTFAEYMNDYKNIIKDTNYPLLTVQCKNYCDNPQLFIENLLGISKKTNGFLDNSKNKIILFKDIERLPTNAFTTLTSCISDLSYTNIGDSTNKPLETQFIATTKLKDNDILKDLKRYFPVGINIPSLKQRGIYEKMQIIFSIFSGEARNMNIPISVDKNMVVLYCLYNYDQNISDLKKMIQDCCMNAHLRYYLNNNSKILITYEDLPIEITGMRSQTSAQIIRLLDVISSDEIYFDSKGESVQVQQFNALSEKYDDLRNQQFFSILDSEYDNPAAVSTHISEMLDVLDLCVDSKLRALKEIINETVSSIVTEALLPHEKFYHLLRNPHLLYGLLLHLSHLIQRTAGGPSKNEIFFSYSDKEIEILTTVIARHLQESFNISLDYKDMNYIAIYLDAIIQRNENRYGIVVICQGNSIASEMVENIKMNYPDLENIAAINFNSEMQLNDCLELILYKISQFKDITKVILAIDTYPLTDIDRIISKKISYPIIGIKGISNQRLYDICSKALNMKDAEAFTEKTTEIYEEIYDSEKDYIDRIAKRILPQIVTFIDIEKTVGYLRICFSKILNGLHLDYTDALASKFFLHSINMVERVISHSTWKYSHLNKFIENHKEMFDIVAQNFKDLENAYSVVVPVNEIAYVVELFL